ncbi:bacitracin transport system permease protein [Fontibacillus solani]|uniref:Bacitracin transport system permease protein n=1 Tax=Fontibacillus solani TaxID=1572857 RepID=A0A7W3XS45_9BACL|nr:ABC transporter permease [Fontibacillus solani]MBA9086151.1 bacitracin transport system permease protein [Fontibacillus solani]
MSINYIILRNLKKNAKNYYLYVFALIFSVALYFAFVTLQYDPAMDEAKGTIKGAAALGAASVLLIAIVTVFLLYANNLFIKRRSKEIGLFQLIGLTKNKIFRILTAENFILYFCSLMIGIGLGFAGSKLLLMILFKITAVDVNATLNFSVDAFIQTMAVFLVIYVLIMLMNYTFMKRQSILSLFRVQSSTEEQVKKVSFVEILIGILGICMILGGYYLSSKLFGGDFTSMPELLMAMITILGSVIIGTYLFYKGSVRFIFYLIRKQKSGYLNIREVLSLSSIMFRMKSNALMLTIITTVSALAIGLLSLSYISYYSAEQSAKNSVPSDFTFASDQDAEQFKQALTTNQIPFDETRINVIQVETNFKDTLEASFRGTSSDSNTMIIGVISDSAVEGLDLPEGEVRLSGFSDILKTFLSFKESGAIEFKGQHDVIPGQMVGIEKDYIVSWYFTNGSLPIAIVDDSVFEHLKKDLDPEIQKESNTYIGVDIADQDKLIAANDIFLKLPLSQDRGNDSQLRDLNSQKQTMGLIMFIVGFLGLTFLVTSGCILYFKQMDESEEEKPNYTILRKLGFTEGDLLKGIQAKQIFNFGIPLIVGLFHSYFAVKSGWFLFGSELWTPMMIVMVVYTVLYSIFGFLSVLYYKKVINGAL